MCVRYITYQRVCYLPYVSSSSSPRRFSSRRADHSGFLEDLCCLPGGRDPTKIGISSNGPQRTERNRGCFSFLSAPSPCYRPIRILPPPHGSRRISASGDTLTEGKEEEERARSRVTTIKLRTIAGAHDGRWGGGIMTARWRW